MTNKTNFCRAGAFVLICVLIIWKLYLPNGIGLHTLKESETNSIKKRLEEANENWKRGLKIRKELENKNLLDKSNPWSYKNGIAIWDFFYPNFDCPHTTERIGKSGDGGKWICGLTHLAKKPSPCIVYSYGVSYDTSFEEEIVARTNCSVYLFDHTIDIDKIKLPKLHPDRVFIEKLGLGAKDTKTLRSISSTMRMYGHSFIDILKIDIEGAEFVVFDNFRKEFTNNLPFGQVSMEIHLMKNSKDSYEKYKTWLTNLEDMGLRAFRNEVNFVALRLSYNHYPNLCEYSFINVKNSNNYLLKE